MKNRSGFDPFTDAQHWDTLPVISLGEWFSGTEAARQSVAKALYEGATGPGFFYISDHGIPDSLIEGAYAASRSFHDQPEPLKAPYYVGNNRHHRGWVPQSETEKHKKDGGTHYSYHEAFDLSFDVSEEDPRTHAGYGMVGPNVWPELAGFRSQITAYYEAIYALGREIMAAFEMSLDLRPGTFLDHVTIPSSQLRLLKYFENDAPSDEMHHGIEPHSDYECFTILHTSAPGLQVLSYEGHWVEALPMPGCFIVNIGDCLEAWTGGLFKATQHRVVNTGRERYSLPFFFATDYDVEIRPLPGFECERYPPIVAGQHLWGSTIRGFPYLQRLREAGALNLDFDIPEESPFKRLSLEEQAVLTERKAQADKTN